MQSGDGLSSDAEDDIANVTGFCCCNDYKYSFV
jgi:hypothetical protein